MNMESYTREFKGSELKTPFDQMRANAMINAGHDDRGLSVLHFNICAFLNQGRRNDIHYILKLWAIEPINKNAQKFRKYPEAGYNALLKRITILEKSLSKHRNIGYWFTKDAAAEMRNALEKEMQNLSPNFLQGERKTA